MAIEIIDETPDPSVIKDVICEHCGIKLTYLPVDLQISTDHHYDGSSTTRM